MESRRRWRGRESGSGGKLEMARKRGDDKGGINQDGYSKILDGGKRLAASVPAWYGRTTVGRKCETTMGGWGEEEGTQRKKTGMREPVRFNVPLSRILKRRCIRDFRGCLDFHGTYSTMICPRARLLPRTAICSARMLVKLLAFFFCAREFFSNIEFFFLRQISRQSLRVFLFSFFCLSAGTFVHSVRVSCCRLFCILYFTR